MVWSTQPINGMIPVIFTSVVTGILNVHDSIVKRVRVRKGIKLKLSHVNQAKLPTVAPPYGEEAGENSF